VDDAGPAGAGHGDVGQFAAAAFGEALGAVGCGALFAVHREGVAVVEVVLVDLGAGEGDLAAAVGLHRERLDLLVDGDDSAALAGRELAAVVGGEGDDEVADGVAASVGGDEVGSGEPAELLGPGPGEAVEVGDTGSPPSQHQRVVAGCGVGGPGVDHRRQHLGAGGGDVDAPVSGVEADGGLWVAVPEVIECNPFGGVALTQVLAEGGDDLGVPLQHRVERASGPDRAQLAGIADDYKLAAGSFNAEHEPGQVGIGCHAGLIQHHDRPPVQGELPVVEAMEQ
jgi:hypothetical protein